jgi:hypothetical protein
LSTRENFTYFRLPRLLPHRLLPLRLLLRRRLRLLLLLLHLHLQEEE